MAGARPSARRRTRPRPVAGSRVLITGGSSGIGRLPPRLYGIYRPEDVAREVARAIGHPRTERTVGDLMAVLAFVDAIAPNATLPLLGRLAKAGWRNRDSRPLDPADALTEPSADAELRSGALGSRPSVLVRSEFM